MAGDANWSSVVLAMHMDGSDNGTTFTDVKGKTVTRNGNTVTKTGVKKFGTASAYFDGSGDYLTLANSTDFNFGTGDYTIEAWIYTSTVSGYHVIFGGSNSGELSFYTVGSGVELGRWGVAGVASTSQGIISINTWHHVAATRSGTTVRLFVDGVVKATATNSSDNTYSGLLRIGVDISASNGWSGYIDDLRITKGVARYTSDFTAPTAAFLEYAGQISGTVKDDANTGAVRTIVAFDRTSPTTTTVKTTSASDGTYTLNCNSLNQHTVIALDDAAGTTYNDLVKRATPA